MNILRLEPNPSGAYPPMQSWSGSVVPDGFYEVADGVELSCGGFGTLTVVDNVVTAFTPDTEAWAAWQAANPEATAQPPETDKLRADVDYIAVMTGVTL